MVPVILVFANLPCCHDCFMKLNEYFNHLRENKFTFILILIIKTEDNIIIRKLSVNYFKDLIKVDSIFFDFNQEINGDASKQDYSYFKYYKIINTPSILIVNKDKETFIPYKLIFIADKRYTSSNIIEDALKK